MDSRRRRLIRQNENLKTVPIIAVTAHQEDDFRSDAKASGFDAYVTKPIDVNWLKELIAGLLINPQISVHGLKPCLD